MKEGYTFGTATLEIILLVIAAFLLGMLLCWLLRKLGICCTGHDDVDTSADHQRMAQPADVNSLRSSMRAGSGNTNQQPPQRVSASRPPQATGDANNGRDQGQKSTTTATTAAAGVAATAATGAAAVKLTGDTAKLTGDTATYTAKHPAGEDGETTRTITGDKAKGALDNAESKAQGLMSDVKERADDTVEAAKDTASDASDAAKGTAGAIAGAAAGAVGSTAARTDDGKPDDLKKLEGIGPKIEQLLHGAGIKTFAQLATQERDTLKTILEAGGNRFKMHEPKSWPYQAELAAKGDWERLKEYQDFLIGGREK